MAYRCDRSNYSKRFYKEGVVYDSIGTAQESFFTDLNPSEAVETVEPDEAQEVRDQLDELGVEYNSRLGLKKLNALLAEAHANALTS